MKHSPPKLFLKFFRWFCSRDLLTYIEGDLFEMFENNIERKGIRKARIQFMIDVIKLFRPSIIRPFFKYQLETIGMIKHHLKISWRRLLLDKTFSFINLIGLVIGISAVFLLSKYIGFHLTIDDFQEKNEQIFAIHQTLSNTEGKKDFSELTYSEVGTISKEYFPQVVSMSRYISTGEALVSATRENGEQYKFNELGIVEVDPDFSKMFTLNFLEGNPETALEEPNTIVLTASMAKKYFGDENPVGKSIKTKRAWGTKKTLKVTGVIEDYPKKSQLKFSFLESFAGREFDEKEHGWNYPNIKSYVLIKEPEKAETFELQLEKMINGLDAFKVKNQNVDFHLVSLSEQAGVNNSLKLLILVGVVLLIITWINYTNLSGAKSLTRGREFGVRRALGSNKNQLIKQFLYEGLFIYLIATVAIFVIVLTVYPILFVLFEEQMLPILEFEAPINYILLLFLIIGGGLSSSYPSFSVFGFSITGLLRNTNLGNARSQVFQKFLVIFQFTVSIVMLIGITVIYQQMKFISNQDVGFNTDQVMIIKAPKDDWEGKRMRLRSFKNELRERTFIKAVTNSNTIPLWWHGEPTNFRLEAGEENTQCVLLRVDEEYFNCFGVDIIAGESFQRNRGPQNRKKVLINEKAAREMGFNTPADALNQKVVNLTTEKELEIVGVVKNYHHNSLRSEIRPQAFEFNPTIGFVSVNLNLSETASLDNLFANIESIEEVWKQVYPDQAFDYYFLDDRFDDIYKRERLFQQVFLGFTIISVLITFLGIFGLSMFISLRRRKEFGIRKVLGANQIHVVNLYTRVFIKKGLLAILIGIPIAYQLLTLWLSNFSYRIALNAWVLIIPCIILILFTLFSLSFESIKMAKLNPLNMLKDE